MQISFVRVKNYFIFRVADTVNRDSRALNTGTLIFYFLSCKSKVFKKLKFI